MITYHARRPTVIRNSRRIKIFCCFPHDIVKDVELLYNEFRVILLYEMPGPRPWRSKSVAMPGGNVISWKRAAAGSGNKDTKSELAMLLSRNRMPGTYPRCSCANRRAITARWNFPQVLVGHHQGCISCAQQGLGL